MDASKLAPPRFHDIEVQRIRRLLQAGQYQNALAAAERLRSESPDNRDALYMVAVAYRFLHRTTEALVTLQELEKYHPRYARLHQERGHCYIAMRSPGRAIDSFLCAVEFNPSLPGSWRALQLLYTFTDQMEYSRDAAAHLANLLALPPEVVSAYSMFADGEICEAETLIREFLLRHGNHVEGMLLLAKIGISLDVADDAEMLLENVLLLALTITWHDMNTLTRS